MSVVMQSQLEAYLDTRDDGFLRSRYGQILAKLGSDSLSNTEIARRVGLPINCVTPRVKELREKGVLALAGWRCCGVTGRRVMVWARVGSSWS